jgi:HlyD family secretion protein
VVPERAAGEAVANAASAEADEMCARFLANPLIEGSGTIEATQVQIAGKAPGRVADVLVRSGDPVAAGAVLVRFDTQEVDAQVAQADAAVAAARVRVAQAEVGLRAQRTQAASSIAQADAAQSAAQARVPQASVAVTLQQEQWEQDLARATARAKTAKAVKTMAAATTAAPRRAAARAS